MMLPTPTWAVGGNTPPKPLQKPIEEAPSKTSLKKPVPLEKSKAVVKEDDDPDIDYAGVLDGTVTVEVPDEIRVLSSLANLGDRDYILLTSAQLLAQMPKEERVLRTTFVREYLYDFDPLLAAIRTGFLNVRAPSQQYSPAMNAARALMAEPVVQRLIKECMSELLSTDGAEQIVVTSLFREATNYGPSGNAAARTGATKLIAKLIEKAKARLDGKDAIKGNVMYMPTAPGSEEAWQKKAVTSQQKLRDSVRA